MGDMADMLIEQGFEQWMDGEGYEDEPLAPSFKTCRYCGKGGFHWESHDDKWRLCDSKGVHRCTTKSLPVPPKPRVITDPVEKAFRAGHEAGYTACLAETCPDVGMSMSVSVGEAYLAHLKTNPPKQYEPSIGEGVADGV